MKNPSNIIKEEDDDLDFKDKINVTVVNEFKDKDDGNTIKALEAKRPSLLFSTFELSDISKSDMVDPGDFIPCCYYSFNSQATADQVQLQLRGVVHGVAEPIAALPFLSRVVQYDPLFEQFKNICGDPAIFPFNATGNSFKSALSKFKNIGGKVLKMGSRVHKFITLLQDAGVFDMAQLALSL